MPTQDRQRRVILLALGLGAIVTGGAACGDEPPSVGGAGAGGLPGSGGTSSGGRAGAGGASSVGGSGAGGGAEGCSRRPNGDAQCVAMGYPPYAYFCSTGRPDPTCVLYTVMNSGDAFCCP